MAFIRRDENGAQSARTDKVRIPEQLERRLRLIPRLALTASEVPRMVRVNEMKSVARLVVE